MQLFFVFLILFIIVLIGLVSFMFKRRNSTINESVETNGNGLVSVDEQENMFSIQVKQVESISEDDLNYLAEITDKKVLAKIDNAIPAVAKIISSVDAGNKVKNLGELYQVVIPKGAELYKSKSMESAVRGFYKMDGVKGIAGNANLVKADGAAYKNLAVLNTVNAVMSVASMVVGQYFMTQINGELEGISSSVQEIADFQKNEYKSKVYTLIAEVQKASTFQVEIIDNNELRNRELQHLKSLEHECAELIGQANFSIEEISKKYDIDFKNYEKTVDEAELWCQYQSVLLEVMNKLSELTYAMNLGAISLDNSRALVQPFMKQAERARISLLAWHSTHKDKFAIDLEDGRRKRKGAGGLLMKIPGLFNDDLNYQKLSDKMIANIEHQGSNTEMIQLRNVDLFEQDVKLFIKEGKVYYLPIYSDEA